MNIRQELTKIVSGAFEKLGYAPEYGAVTVSGRPDLCQFQCNGAMAAAKEYRTAPAAIADGIAECLRMDKRFSSVESVKPGFINMSLSDAWLAELMNAAGGDDRLTLPLMEPRTIVVDYGGANVAKPLHVGHLRSAIIGDTLCRLARFLGHRVISDVHLGDWGLQMGLVIAEIEREQPELCYFDPDYEGDYPAEPPVTVDELNVIYPAASARSKTDAEFAAKAARATVELQDGRAGYTALWRHVRGVSIADLKRNYGALGVSFDYWYGESDADKYIPRVIGLLRNKKLLRESDGAMVVDTALPEDKEPMPPMIVVKSNGGDMYGTTDLGTILQRVEDWKPDEIWYVVDNRQALHFKQVFRCAALAGLLDNTDCIHINFGTMNGRDGKPYKTRDGGVMRLSDMIGDVTKSAYDKASGSDIAMSEEEKLRVARAVGVAAIKIGDMLNHRTRDFIFDMDRFLAYEGKTGPYLQYTAVRINSLLAKAGEAKVSSGDILPPASGAERELQLSLLSVADALPRALAEKAPNIICEVLFDVAGAYNRFYFENKILTCPEEGRRASWLSLSRLTGDMLGILLGLLGIEVPENM